jgi:hypothetical protein
VKLERQPDGFDEPFFDQPVDPDRVDIAEGSDVIRVDEKLDRHG